MAAKVFQLREKENKSEFETNDVQPHIEILAGNLSDAGIISDLSRNLHNEAEKNATNSSHNAEMPHKNAILAGLLLGKKFKAINADYIDHFSFLETQSLPGKRKIKFSKYFNFNILNSQSSKN